MLWNHGKGTLNPKLSFEAKGRSETPGVKIYTFQNMQIQYRKKIMPWMKMVRMTPIISGKRNTTVNYQEGWQGMLKYKQYTIGSPS